MTVQGTMVVIVGPSGVGKDSVLTFAAQRMAADRDFTFVRRTITRPADEGGENHESVTIDEFAHMDNEARFCVSWSAHGLKYGIPMSCKHFVDHGGIAVCNGSRQALSRFEDTFPKLYVVAITADPDILAERLYARGRETTSEISGRLERSVNIEVYRKPDLIIDNSHELAQAGDSLIAYLKTIRNNEHKIGAAGSL
jgi:ribose 1,5-bisphosphokinase